MIVTTKGCKACGGYFRQVIISRKLSYSTVIDYIYLPLYHRVSFSFFLNTRKILNFYTGASGSFIKKKSRFVRDVVLLVNKVCEMWWTQGRPGGEHLVTQLLPLMLARSLDEDAKEADVKRVYGYVERGHGYIRRVRRYVKGACGHLYRV